MNTNISAFIDNLWVLSDEKKNALKANIEQNSPLSDDKSAQLMELLKQYEDVQNELIARQTKQNPDFIAEMKKEAQDEYMKALHQKEEASIAAESAALEDLENQLDNLF